MTLAHRFAPHLPHPFWRGHRQLPALEWQILDSEEETAWRAVTAQARRPAAPAARFSVARGWLILLPCLLTLFALAVWAGNWADHQSAALQEELELAVEAERWTNGSPALTAGPDRSAVKPAQDDLAFVRRHELPGEVRLIDLCQDQAVVSVEIAAVAAGETPASYRQTQVYAWSAQGWTRSAPSPVTWGEPRSLESAYFIYAYWARDHDAVVAAADRLDRLYPALNAAYPMARPRQKLLVTVSPTVEPRTALHRFAPFYHLTTASPELYLAPDAFDDVDLLTQAVALAVASDRAIQYVYEITASDSPLTAGAVGKPVWYHLAYGVRIWQILDADPTLPLAGWRVPLIHWLLDERMANPAEDSSSLAEAFCRDAAVWRLIPETIDIPVHCAAAQGVAVPSASWSQTEWFHNQVSPLRLDYLLPLFAATRDFEPEFVHSYPSLVAGIGYPPHPAGPVAIATVVDYAAHTYGAATIPQLLAQAPQHAGWDTLVPAVFGVSAAEFENGWLSFLAEEYGVHVAQATGVDE